MGHTEVMSAEPTERRETLALAAPDARLVDRLVDPDSLERWALNTLTELEASASKSSVLRAAFRVGTDRITEQAMDESYRQLAEQTTEDRSLGYFTTSREQWQPFVAAVKSDEFDS